MSELLRYITTQAKKYNRKSFNTISYENTKNFIKNNPTKLHGLRYSRVKNCFIGYFDDGKQDWNTVEF